MSSRQSIADNRSWHLESFAEIQRLYPELIAVDAKGVVQPSRDLWLKEAEESIKLAGATGLGDNVWVCRVKALSQTTSDVLTVLDSLEMDGTIHSGILESFEIHWA